jgi:hypothetical protein
MSLSATPPDRVSRSEGPNPHGSSGATDDGSDDGNDGNDGSDDGNDGSDRANDPRRSDCDDPSQRHGENVPSGSRIQLAQLKANRRGR